MWDIARIEHALQTVGQAVVRRIHCRSSINELCARIGMTTGAFYNSFDGKDAFFKSR